MFHPKFNDSPAYHSESFGALVWAFEPASRLPIGDRRVSRIWFVPRRSSKLLSKYGVSGKAFNVILERRNRADELLARRVLNNAAADHMVEKLGGIVFFGKAHRPFARLGNFADMGKRIFA